MGDAMKSGRLTWYLQRYSALYFISFLAYSEYTFWTSGITFQFLNSSNVFKALLSIFILLACVHAYIGLWTVGTDYLTRRTIGFLSYRISKYADTLRSIYTVVFSLFGLSYLIVSLTIVFNNLS